MRELEQMNAEITLNKQNKISLAGEVVKLETRKGDDYLVATEAVVVNPENTAWIKT
jgi:hypothetical protein